MSAPPDSPVLIERGGRLYIDCDGRRVPVIAGGTGIETVAIIVAVAAVAAAGVAAYSQYQQGQAQNAAQKYNAKVAENQALAARQQAEFAANQQRERSRRLIANERALYGTAGVDVSAGSPLLVVADSAKQAELDAQATLAGGAARSSGFEAQGTLDRFMGRQAVQAGNLGAGATLLSGAASGASAYARYSGTGPTVPQQNYGYM